MSQAKRAKIRVKAQPKVVASSIYSTSNSTTQHSTQAQTNLNDISIEGYTPTQIQEHRPGSILKIRMENFVTYDYCELSPGPNMNLVIGPNGSGKSTIVCAIALGLGGSPNVLGRAKEISEFVKHGESKGFVEIELQGDPKTKQKLLIKRIIQKENNTSFWQVNGKSSTKNEVLSLIQKFNIQVDNLCQFLPQDKVAEFAQMSSTELLLATQKAAGKPELQAQLTKLIKLRSQQKDFNSTFESDQAQLKDLEEKHEQQRKEVDRYFEREESQKKIQLFKLRIPFKKYAFAKEQYDEIKEQRKAAHAINQDIIKKVKPLTMIKVNEQGKLKALETKAVELTSHQRVQRGTINNIYSGLEEKSEAIVEAKRELGSLKQSQKNHGLEIKKKESDVAALQDKVNEGPPPDQDLEPINQKINEIGVELSAKQSQLETLQNAKDQISRYEMPQLSNQLSKYDVELKRMADVKQIRRDAIRRFSPDTGKAMDWLEENRGLFKERVFDPLILEIDVVDMKFAQVVENCINPNAIKTFVCQNKEDYVTFTREVIDKMKFRVNASEFSHRSLSDFKPPTSIENIRKFGFVDYALNLVEGPQPVLVALNQMCQLHSMPVSLTGVDNVAVESSRLIGKYIAGPTRYSMAISEYGRKSHSVSTERLRPVKFLGQAQDPTQVAHIQGLQCEVRTQLQLKQEELERIQVQGSDINSQVMQLKAKKEQELALKREATNKAKTYQRIKIALETTINKLEDLRRKTFDDKIDKINKKINVLAESKVAVAEKLKENLDIHIKDSGELWIIKTKIIEHKSRLLWMERAMRQAEDVRAKAQHRFASLDAQYSQAGKKAMSLLAKAKALLTDLDEETKIALGSFGLEESLEELEEGLITEQAKVDAALGPSAAIMEAFKDRIKTIEGLKERVEKRGKSKLDIDKALEQAKRAWVPEIQKLVRVISHNFSAAFKGIGCDGEVRLNEHDDFDKWGIDILVRFRELEKLQVLTGQRQSGGEKSVSTIMYLMALQELASSPFRVVDEINQGMDPRNERLVHKQLVQTACRPNSAQYFLITPKLLPNLTYHISMKVLCIYNGEWMPNKLDTKPYLNKLKRSHSSVRILANSQD